MHLSLARRTEKRQRSQLPQSRPNRQVTMQDPVDHLDLPGRLVTTLTVRHVLTVMAQRDGEFVKRKFLEVGVHANGH